MEDHIGMTPFPVTALKEIVGISLVQEFRTTGGPVGREFMRYNDDPINEPTYHQLHGSASK